MINIDAVKIIVIFIFVVYCPYDVEIIVARSVGNGSYPDSCNIFHLFF